MIKGDFVDTFTVNGTPVSDQAVTTVPAYLHYIVAQGVTSLSYKLEDSDGGTTKWQAVEASNTPGIYIFDPPLYFSSSIWLDVLSSVGLSHINIGYTITDAE